MHFYITITHDKKRYRLFVEQVLWAVNKEQFKVKGKEQDVVFESDRPLWRMKGIKHRPPTWKLISGDMWNMDLRNTIIKAMQAYLEPPLKNR